MYVVRSEVNILLNIGKGGKNTIKLCNDFKEIATDTKQNIFDCIKMNCLSHKQFKSFSCQCFDSYYFSYQSLVIYAHDCFPLKFSYALELASVHYINCFEHETICFSFKKIINVLRLEKSERRQEKELSQFYFGLFD